MLNVNFFVERRLLKACAQDDAAAQRRFALLSYLNRIHKTATRVNRQYNRPLDDDELKDLCKVLTAQIYKAYALLPSFGENLYGRIDTYVFAAVLRYLQEATR